MPQLPGSLAHSDHRQPLDFSEGDLYFFKLLACCAQTRDPYVSMGLIIPVIIHRIWIGGGPHYMQTARLRSISSCFALLHLSRIWCVKRSLASSVIPRYLTVGENLISLP